MRTDVTDGVKPCESFRSVIIVLTFVGIYEIQSNRKYVQLTHKLFRIIVLIIIFVYNVQHITFLFLTQDNAAFWDGLLLEFPQMTLFVKVLTIFVNISRIRRLHELLNDPILFAVNAKDVEYLEKNTHDMIRLSKLSNISMVGGTGTWMISMIMKRVQNPTVNRIPSYVPFDTSSWTGYSFAAILETAPIVWTGFGHFACDCVVATYFSQVTIQLKMLKYNLEHLFDKGNANGGNEAVVRYKDEINENLQKRFKYYVIRYNKIAWFSEEVIGVFNRSISFNFFVASVHTCLAVFNMSMYDVFSVPFIHKFSFVILIKLQVLIYCYYGDQVEFESQSVTTAMYSSDWVSVSPRFRRQILIAMARWAKPLTPRVSYIVPVSLVTFMSIARTAYTLYTVMKSTQQN